LACLALPTATREAFAGVLRRTVMAPLVAIQVRAELARTAVLEHNAALRLADSVALRSLRLAGVEQENERLRLLLGLGAGLRWGFVPAEALEGRGVGEEFTATLSAGASQGVERLAPVVAPEGVVGLIDRVDRSMSIAILWLHPAFRVSAMAADGGAYGIVQPHHGSGAERFLLELRGVPQRSTLKPGDVVVSSGLGGTFPRGIPVGTVVSELRTAEQWVRTYLLKPAVSLPDVGTVLILRPERVRAGVQGVWAVGSADSAERAVRIAGDSLARLDSLRRRVPARGRPGDSLSRNDSLLRKVSGRAAPGLSP
jgi:rod shape-determining protein MreC